MVFEKRMSVKDLIDQMRKELAEENETTSSPKVKTKSPKEKKKVKKTVKKKPVKKKKR